MKKLGTESPAKAQVTKILGNTELNKSQKIKALFDIGLETKEISELLGIRYNFAYNVLSNYCNMHGIKVEVQEKEGKKERIIELFNAGKSNKEISIELKANSNYVFNVLKAYKATLPKPAENSEEVAN